MEALTEIRCASCGGQLDVGTCSELCPPTGKTTWWVCSHFCAYRLGAKHASELSAAESWRAQRRIRSRAPALRRGGRS